MDRRLGFALVLVLASASCRSTATSAPPPPEPPPALGAGNHDWEDLVALEAWLDGSGPDHYPDAAVAAELELAEGRLKYAKRDAGKAPGGTLTRRLASAESGFRRVLTDPRASALERHRAKAGLDEARGLRSAPAPVASTAGLAVHARSAWGARTAVPALLTEQRSGYRRITVHHSAPPSPLPHDASPAAYADEIRRIQRYHMEEASPLCGDIGYHFLIDPRGAVYEGRSLAWQGAHAGGANNVDNVGICLLGDYGSTRPTQASLQALDRLIQDLSRRYGIPRDPAHLKGHRELKTTECPGDHLMSWLVRYRTSS